MTCDTKKRMGLDLAEKHGVSFEEASVLFTRGDDYLEIFDDAHSGEEDRFIAIGPIARGLVLVVYPSAMRTPCVLSARGGRRSGRPNHSEPMFEEGRHDRHS